MTDADGQPSDPNTVVVSSVNASPVADAGVDQGALVGRSIISRKTLRLFWEKPEYGDAEQSLKASFKEASDADWASPAAIKAAFRSASIVANNRVVFSICGNKYRLVVKVNYPYRVIYIRFVGTHAQYGRIKVEEI